MSAEFVPDTSDVILNSFSEAGDTVQVLQKDGQVKPAIMLSRGFNFGTVCYSAAENKGNCKLCEGSGNRPAYCKILL